jgi:hypothetical protein
MAISFFEQDPSDNGIAPGATISLGVTLQSSDKAIGICRDKD